MNTYIISETNNYWIYDYAIIFKPDFNLEFGDNIINIIIDSNIDQIIFADYIHLEFALKTKVDPMNSWYEHLKKINIFNQEINIFNLTNIKTIFFGCDFNQLVNNLPLKLEKLKLGHCFNQIVDNLPSSLIYLEFGFNFNQLVNNLPLKLENVKFGFNFNQIVDNLPLNLKYIEFGYIFNHLVEDLPNKLKKINFGNKFDQPINNLPNSVEEIILGNRFYSQEIIKVPSNLIFIKISENYKFKNSKNSKCLDEINIELY